MADHTSPCSEFAAAHGVVETLRRYWGYETLRPMQAEAIEAGIDGRDSLIVLPTGGGKSLCYQIPAVLCGGLDVVISPLISLMKDQVDALRQCGYPAAALHSSLSSEERAEVFRGLEAGTFRLLFASPERLANGGFTAMLQRFGVRAFAIDEAHCISHWGHDFRPEYRQLATLKERFPDVSIHAYTATATERVRADIVSQLGLENARVLVGVFDRPNLVYRVLPKVDVAAQIIQVLRRHTGEASIVYCLSRRDTESLAATLQANGFKAAHYHAGLASAERTHTQDAFAAEEIDIVVATVAFGMGIDRSNVRCVIHASLPKSVEHYQQETGRAGRDGLEAECVLLYSYSDVARWEGLIDLSARDVAASAEFVEAQKELLHQMKSMCSTLECRHRAISRYFGQRYPKNTCEACDVCLEEVEGLAKSTTIARKILSAVARTEQRYGAGHVAAVLRGSNTEQVRRAGHDGLSVFGIITDFTEKALTNLVYQLVDMGLLVRQGGAYPTLALTDDGVALMRGEQDVKLVDPRRGDRQLSVAEAESWEGVDRELFEQLRAMRKRVAQERGVPAFVIFGDGTLRDLARVRPTSLDVLQSVKGIGSKKLADFGEQIVHLITQHCELRGMSTDQHDGLRIVRVAAERPNPEKERAMEMFEHRHSLDEVMTETGRARRTVAGYLEEFIRSRKPERIDVWVEPTLHERIVQAAVASGGGSHLKPIHTALDGQVAYEDIRIALAYEAVRQE